MHLKWWWIDRRVYEYFAVAVAPFFGRRRATLVYQMGKVGSSAIRNSLFRLSDPRLYPVLMSHEFHPVRDRDLGRLDIEAELRDAAAAEIENERAVFRLHTPRRRRGLRFRERFYCEKIFDNYVKRGAQLRVITLVRDPIAHNVSYFFQVMDRYVGRHGDPQNPNAQDLIHFFLERYRHDRPLLWLDAELKTTLGIDVYSQPFPQDRGFMQLSHGNVDLLLLKFELERAAKTRAIRDFLGLDDFELLDSNVTDAKSHGKAYKRFKEEIRIPEAMLTRMYESKYARHFYSDAERARFRARWSGAEAAA